MTVIGCKVYSTYIENGNIFYKIHIYNIYLHNTRTKVKVYSSAFKLVSTAIYNTPIKVKMSFGQIRCTQYMQNWQQTLLQN